MAEEEGEGKGTRMLPGRRAPAGSFVLKVLTTGGLGVILGENLNRIFMGFPRCVLSGSGLH